MVKNCDLRLLQRVLALAENITAQFSDLSEVFDDQVEDFIAYNGLYAARQVLLNNCELSLNKRVEAVKEFFAQPIMENAFKKSIMMPCPNRFKLKLRFALKKRPLFLFLIFKINNVLHTVKS